MARCKTSNLHALRIRLTGRCDRVCESSHSPRCCAYWAHRWIKRNSIRGQGVRATAGTGEAYPEVSGYLIPTLLNLGDYRLACRYARWLVSIQNPDGSWNGPTAYGKPYTFDTGQILKGLLAISPRMPKAVPALLRGCDWLADQIDAEGRIHTPVRDSLGQPDGTLAPEAFHLYAMEPLRTAAIRFGKNDYEKAITRAIRYYRHDPNLGVFNSFSHFHAYILEALVDLGEMEFAAKAMRQVENSQNEDGAIPGYPEAKWICSAGVAQYALIWLKLGQLVPARRALGWLCANQNPSGGFLGSYGRESAYFPEKEISWTAKFFLDAYLRLKKIEAKYSQ